MVKTDNPIRLISEGHDEARGLGLRDNFSPLSMSLYIDSVEELRKLIWPKLKFYFFFPAGWKHSANDQWFHGWGQFCPWANGKKAKYQHHSTIYILYIYAKLFVLVRKPWSWIQSQVILFIQVHCNFLIYMRPISDKLRFKKSRHEPHATIPVPEVYIPFDTPYYWIEYCS